MEYNHKTGLALIELLMTVAVITVIGLSGGYLMVNIVRNNVYIPSQLNVEMAASDILEFIISGDTQARGLRFSRAVTEAEPYRVRFIDQDGQDVVIELPSGQNRFVRSVDGGGAAAFPYYLPLPGVEVAGKNNRVFTYDDASGNQTSDPADVRGVVITVVVQAGSGLYENWEGVSEQTSAIAVKRF